ncbi:hypothetical protein N7530_011866 [Penicillium desertorum]|uniref:Uncharacterized protein n=1 Tax=Penicillium desertorum TaxID=1303715 RepID=A0A9W9WEK1_9EURO|nr:hypothetical protein N7530_011866 [Penicillium desertorum]
MDDVPRSWFPSELDEGEKVTLDMPKPSTWVIGKLVNTHSYQSNETNVPSYACAQFECARASNQEECFMRIYVQVPFTGYEHADRDTIAQQAAEFTPPELNAYKFLTDNGSRSTPKLRAYKQDTQDPNGPIPGGHITWIVWQKVPGKCLGGIRDASVYWGLRATERKLVRDAFLRELPEIMKMGYFPRHLRPRHLIWDKARNNLYFVGFRDVMPFEAKGTFGEEWLPYFDLAKPPQRNYRKAKDYKGDTSGWVL